MRLLACVLMLALVPTVAAQAAFPKGTLDMEVDVPLDTFEPGDVFNITVEVVYNCPPAAADLTGPYTLDLFVNADPEISITGPATKSLESGACLQGGSHVMEFPLRVDVGEWANDTLLMVFEADLHSSNEPLAPSPDEVRQTAAIKVDGKPVPQGSSSGASMEAVDEPLEANVPGPALPLLAAGLLALARRRQA